METEPFDHVGYIRGLQIHNVPAEAIVDLEIPKDRLADSIGLATSPVTIYNKGNASATSAELAEANKVM